MMSGSIVRIHLWRVFVVCSVILFAAAVVQAADPEPSLTLSVDRKTVAVGGHLFLDLDYTLPPGASLSDKTEIDGLHDLTVIEEMVTDGTIKIRCIVDRLENFTIGPVGITYMDSEGNRSRLESDTVDITVKSNLGDKPEDAVLRPIQEIMPITTRWGLYLPWIIAAILIAVVVVGWCVWRKRRRIGEIAAEVMVPPHIRARRELDDLIARGVFEAGDIKTFYFVFSGIIRRYMESVCRFPAAEMTTEEIARRIAPRSQEEDLLPLLRQADLVKFADDVPTSDRKERDMTVARDYIDGTAPTDGETEEGVVAEVAA